MSIVNELCDVQQSTTVHARETFTTVAVQTNNTY